MPSSAHATADAELARDGAAEELGRVGHADEPRAGHLEDAELVRRAEAVLRRAQDAVRVVAVALELEHAVDEVLEHARAGDRAVLGHVADEDRRDARLLRDAQQPGRRLAHLARPSRAPSRARRSRASARSRSRRRRAARARASRRRSRARSRRGSRPARRRRAAAARSLTCAVDSSPVTSSARRSFEIAPSAVSSSVDLPTPGSPPTSTSDAGTSPPPSTRSSSGTPVGMRAASSASTSTRRSSGRRGGGCGALRPGAPRASVPNEPQPGHLPNQRPAV